MQSALWFVCFFDHSLQNYELKNSVDCLKNKHPQVSDVQIELYSI